MTDIVELLRGPVKHPQQSVTLRLEAADEIERLRGEVEAMREERKQWDRVDLSKNAGTKWQPIETAPKDGTWILCWEPNTTIAVPFHWSKVQHVPLYGWVDYAGDDDLQPTHWMQLPETPKDA